MARIEPRRDLAVEPIDQQVVILDRRNERVHELNATASLIWVGIAEGLEVSEVVDSVVEAFDISHCVAKKDVEETVDRFLSLDLLQERFVK